MLTQNETSLIVLPEMVQFLAESLYSCSIFTLQFMNRNIERFEVSLLIAGRQTGGTQITQWFMYDGSN